MTQKLLRSKVKNLLSESTANLPVPADNPPWDRDLINAMVFDGNETVHLVALTNIALAAVDPAFSALSLRDAHDAVNQRGLYKSAVFPVLEAFARDSGSDWSPSYDPYASNPFVASRIDDQWVKDRNKKLKGAEELLILLRFADEYPEYASDLVAEILLAIKEKLTIELARPFIPPHLSPDHLQGILHKWIGIDQVDNERLMVSAECLLCAVGQSLAGGWRQVQTLDDCEHPTLICHNNGTTKLVAMTEAALHAGGKMEILAEIALKKRVSRGFIISAYDAPKMGARDRKVQRHYSTLGMRLSVTSLRNLIETWLPLIGADLSSEAALLEAIGSSKRLSPRDIKALSSAINDQVLNSEQ